jgi:hypothetical protein
MFLSKNQPIEESSPPKFRWARTEPVIGKMARTVFSEKKTGRTLNHTVTDFKHATQTSFHRKPSSKSACLYKRHSQQHYATEGRETMEEPIFAKRCRQSQKPKLITLGNSCELVDPRSASFKDPPSRADRRKKEFLLKKQCSTQGMLQKEIANNRDFILSLEGCLLEM